VSRDEPGALVRTPAGGWLTCEDPLAIFSAHQPGEIASCLARAECAARERGAWVAGFVAYEAAEAFQLPTRSHESRALPLAWFAAFRSARESPGPARGDYSVSRWAPSIDRPTYLAALTDIKQRIAAGDTYQVNYTFRLSADFAGNPLGLFSDLFEAQRGPWSAYVDTGTHAICSASPELFFRVVGGRIECRPMKGTAPRGLWAEDDLARGRALQSSEKNRAENVMIVDMTRNDLGRVARVGSVHVPALYEIERYPGQWQMASTVVAEAPGMLLADLFASLFPSGSVTGAPKHSSMEIIGGLEPGPRGVYTGAVGCVSPGGDAHFNVAIRTVTVDRSRRHAEFGVGSGVVWDSAADDEYEECLNKAAMLARPLEPFRLLETLRWSPADGFVRLERHLARLRASAGYFGFDWPGDASIARRAAAAVHDARADRRIRILLDRFGAVDVEAGDLGARPERPRVAISPEPVRRTDPFLYHKTTRREIYIRARAARPDADAVLLWNEQREVTEATEANLVVELDGRRMTPALACGLLPGVLRGELLERGEVQEGIVRLEDLSRITGLWLASSARGLIRGELS
jgi:para-aminobenzoate synthetase/4-amino-4-deoxychorismate lyase